MDTLQKIDRYKRACLQELLDQYTPKQQAFFSKMYKSVEAIKEESIPWAVQQCERTIVENNNKLS